MRNEEGGRRSAARPPGLRMGKEKRRNGAEENWCAKTGSSPLPPRSSAPLPICVCVTILAMRNRGYKMRAIASQQGSFFVSVGWG
jgi:hypothetical protein